MKFKLEKRYVIEILILLTIVLTVSLGSSIANHYLYIKKHTYTIVFKDIDGIIKGSPVRFLGVVTGHVRNIKIEGNHIHVQIIITQPEVVIPPGSRARVEFSGIAGSKSIEIKPPETDDPTADGIVALKPVRLKDFLDSLEIYSNVLMALENGLVRLSSENTRIFLLEISKRKDFREVDKMLDSAIDFEKVTEKIKANLIKLEDGIAIQAQKVPTATGVAKFKQKLKGRSN